MIQNLSLKPLFYLLITHSIVTADGKLNLFFDFF